MRKFASRGDSRRDPISHLTIAPPSLQQYFIFAILILMKCIEQMLVPSGLHFYLNNFIYDIIRVWIYIEANYTLFIPYMHIHTNSMPIQWLYAKREPIKQLYSVYVEGVMYIPTCRWKYFGTHKSGCNGPKVRNVIKIALWWISSHLQWLTASYLPKSRQWFWHLNCTDDNGKAIFFWVPTYAYEMIFRCGPYMLTLHADKTIKH